MPLRLLGPALPSCRGAETDSWPASRGNAGALGQHPLLGHKPGPLGCRSRCPGPPAPTRLCPAGARCADDPPPTAGLRLPPLLPQAAGHGAPSVPGVSSDGAYARLLVSCVQRPRGTLAHLQHLSFLLSPPPQAPPPQLPEASWGVPPSLLLSPQQPPSVASGRPWWQETGACRAQAAHPVLAALLVPNPLPPTPGGSVAPPGSLFALTTPVISRAGGLQAGWHPLSGSLCIQDRPAWELHPSRLRRCPWPLPPLFGLTTNLTPASEREIALGTPRSTNVRPSPGRR